MRYRVHGVHRTTGTEISQTFEADSEEFAALMASATLLVASIRPEGEPADGLSPSKVLPYQNRGDAKFSSVLYGSLQTSAAVLRVLSVVLYVFAGIGGIAALFLFAYEEAPIGLVVSLAAFVSMIVAAIIRTLAGIGEAVRDLAITAARSTPSQGSRAPGTIAENG